MIQRKETVRVLCLIDSLGSGGAQRQLNLLGVLLKQHGFDVEFLTYRAKDFFEGLLREHDIPVTTILVANKVRRALALRRFVRRRRPHVVIAYQRTGAFYAELAALPRRRFGLIVSERVAVDPVASACPAQGEEGAFQAGGARPVAGCHPGSEQEGIQRAVAVVDADGAGMGRRANPVDESIVRYSARRR